MADARNMNFWIFTLAAGLVMWCIVGCSEKPANGSTTPPLKKEKVVIGGHTFELELAIDPKSREKGLMHRDHIDDNGGMLFVFPDSQVAVQNFWMGHCLVDMDIIYLDRKGTVTAVHRMKAQQPQREGESDADYKRRIPHYSSGYPAQFAIELQGGWLDRLKVRVDQRIELDLARLKAMAR
jgi:uncharacterized membrane protein (UPF0127 family)